MLRTLTIDWLCLVSLCVVLPQGASAQTVADLGEQTETLAYYYRIDEGDRDFSYDLDMNEEWSLVSAPGSRYADDVSGVVFVYRRIGNQEILVDYLYAAENQPQDFYGYSVALDGDVAVVGAPGTNGTDGSGGVIDDRGRVDVWRFDQQNQYWVFEATLPLPGEGAAYENWGHSVAIEGDRIVAGGPTKGTLGVDAGVGQAAVWRRVGGTWLLEDSLDPIGPAADSGRNFGYACAIDNGVVVVGAPRVSTGVAVVYEFDEVFGTWNPSDYLDPEAFGFEQGVDIRRFGDAVAIDGDSMLISAPSTSVGELSYFGRAYLFGRSGNLWNPVQTFVDEEGTEYDDLGKHVFLVEDELIMLYSSLNTRTLPEGSYGGLLEYRYGPNGFQLANIIEPTETNQKEFGSSYAMFGERALIGAYASRTYFKEWDEHVDLGRLTRYRWRSIRNIDAPVGSQFYDNIDDALHKADANDRILVRNDAMQESGILQVGINPVQLIGVEALTLPADMSMFMSDDTTLEISSDIRDQSLSLQGDMLLPEGGFSGFAAEDSGLIIENGGRFYQNDATVFVTPQFETSANGSAFLKGSVLTDLVYVGPDGINRVHGDTDILGDYTNKGTTLVHRGVLYIVGDLVNNGVLLGEVDQGPGLLPGDGPQPGDGMNVAGDYVLGVDAALELPDPAWWVRVGGNLDVAITDPSNFVMNLATVQMTGFSASDQSFEAMSEDLGPNEAGFAPSNFPLGVLRLTADATVQIVNAHPNASNDPCEVVYTEQLIVPFGATLLTGGCPVYVREAFIDGTVDDPDAVIVVGPTCIGDLTGDAIVNGADLTLLLGDWGECVTPCPADLNADGVVSGVDLAILLGTWGGCPGS